MLNELIKKRKFLSTVAPSLVFLIALSLLAPPLYAGVRWAPNGIAVSTAPQDQQTNQERHAILEDGTGGIFVAWTDYRSDPSGDVYALHLSSDGNPASGWTANGKPICDISGSRESSPNLAPDGAGGVIITWSDERNGTTNAEVYAQQVDATGNIGWQASGNLVSSGPTTTPWRFGFPIQSIEGTIVFIIELSETQGLGIYAQKLGNGGDRLCGPFGIPVSTGVATDASTGEFLVGPNGSAIIAWADDRNSGNGFDLFAAKVSSSGIKSWEVPISVGSGDQGYETVSVVNDGSGDTYIVWDDTRSLTSSDIYATRIDSEGNLVLGWDTPNGKVICNASGDQKNPQITRLPTGDIIFTWWDTRNDSGDIYANKVTGSGPPPTWEVIVSSATNSQEYPAITNSGSDFIYIAWQDSRSGGSPDIYTQRLDQNGTRIFQPHGEAVASASGDQRDTLLVQDNTNGAIAVWTDWRSGNADLYAQRISSEPAPADTQAPYVEIQMPQPGVGYYNEFNLTTISGTASDNVAVSQVQVKLRRDDNKYWHSTSSWTEGEEWNPATGTENWFYSQAWWTHGYSYEIVARAQDGSGNFSTDYSTRTFTSDMFAPSSYIQFPVNGGSYSSVSTISGTSQDWGVGVQKVEISIRDKFNNYCWNSSTWVAGEIWLIPTGVNNWFYDSVPLWTNGRQYNVRSRATDLAENTEYTESSWNSSTFTYTGGGDTTSPGKSTGTAATTMSQIKFDWTFPGDDGYMGNVVNGSWIVKYSSNPADTPDTAPFSISSSAVSWVQGSLSTYQLINLKPRTTYYIWVKTRDEVETNWSVWSDTTSAISSGFILHSEPAGTTGIGEGGVSWGDFDNDGDLDLAVNGYDGSNNRFRVYRNDNGEFYLQQDLDGLKYGGVAWGDFDNDGDLDLAVNGFDGSGYRCRIYRNDNGTFNLHSEPAGATGPGYGNVAWGDFDNDGDLDLAVNGYDGSNYRFRVYRNDNGIFNLHSEPAGTIGPGSGNVAWGDYDNDGDLDLAVNGKINSSDYKFIIYRNENSSFTYYREPAGTPGIGDGNVAWGDYDNDGDLDLAVTGTAGSGNYRFRIYRNDNGEFSLQQDLAGLAYGGVSWGDYDNDGNLDLAVNGYDGSGSSGNKFRIYHNDNGTFNLYCEPAGIIGLSNGNVSWGDYDNDGDLDLAVTGLDGGPRFRVYKSLEAEFGNMNSTPTAPTNLSANYINGKVELRWDKGTDSQTTQQNGLYYAVDITTIPGGGFPKIVWDEVNSGWKHAKANFGNYPHGFVSTSPVLQPGYNFKPPIFGTTYYWHVHTIDTSMRASVLSTQQSIYLSPADTTPPQVYITTPSYGVSTYSSLPIISGTASDNVGVSLVEVEIIRQSDSWCWDKNASNWAIAGIWNLASGTNDWNFLSPPWVSGSTYTVVARAKDTNNNYSTWYSTRTFTFGTAAGDTQSPYVDITLPAYGVNSYSNLPTISGTAWDNVGVSEVQVKIIRQSDSWRWDNNASNWAVGDIWNNTLGTNSWSFTSPPWQNGNTYQVIGRAKDTSGNFSTWYSTRTFTFSVSISTVTELDWYATYGSTDNWEEGRGIALDSSGNAYVVGKAYNYDRGDDIWVAKYSSTGERLWTKTFDGGTNGWDYGNGIAVDGSNNLYVVGTVQNSYSYENNIWIAKLDNSSGNLASGWPIIYGAYNYGSDEGRGIAVHSNGNIYVAGSEYTSNEGQNILLLKYNSSGVLQWNRSYHGSNYDYGYSVALDANENVYVTGYEERWDLNQGRNIWVRKYDKEGAEKWTARFNGSGNMNDEGHGIAVDGSGNAYVVGNEYTSDQGDNIWIRKYDTNGVEKWTKRYNSLVNGWDVGWGITVDANANVYATGIEFTSNEGENIWIRKYDSNGNELWAKSYNGPSSSWDRGYGIAVNALGKVYVVGQVYTTTGYMGMGSADIWIGKFSPPETVSLGKISGTLSYSGARTGNLIVGLWSDVNFSGTPLVSMSTGTGNYTIPNLPDSTYYLQAFLDMNDNSSPDTDEPKGKYGAPTAITIYSGSSQSGINVTLTDPAQVGDIVWTRTYNGSGNGWDEGRGIALDSGGNVYVVGQANNSNTGGDIWIRKYGPYGNTLWTRTYSSDENYWDNGWDIAVDGSGNAYAIGSIHSSDMGADIWVAKYDTNGNQIWTKTYGSTGNYSWDEGRGIALDASGNIYLTGTVSNPNYGGNIWIAKLDNLGNMTSGWPKEEANTGYNWDNGWDIALDGTGNIYVSGSKVRSDTGGDIWVAKYNGDGVKQWQTFYSSTGNYCDEGHRLALSGSYLYVTGNINTSDQSGNIWVGKFNTSDGVMDSGWPKTYNGLGSGGDMGWGIAVDGTGNVYVSGSEYSGTEQQQNIWLRKYSPSGTTLWTRTHSGSGYSWDEGRDIVVDGSGNVYVTGSEDTSDQGRNIWVRKYTSASPAGASISGTIYYQGNASGNIIVEAWDNSTFSGSAVNSVSITAPGAYSISNLSDGIYYLRAFRDTNENGAPNSGEAKGYYGMPDKVTLSGGNSVSSKDFSLNDPSGGSVSGKVTDDLGNPLAGAQISVGAWVSSAGVTGYYEISGLADGYYTVSCSPPQGSELKIETKEISISATQGNIVLNFTLSGPGIISGRVTDTYGLSVATASVNISGPSSAHTTTNSSGVYTVGGLPKGDYTVTVTPVLGSPLTAKSKENITVFGGQTTVVDFVLSEPAQISGKVTDSSGNPLAYASISLGIPGYGATTDTNGSYTIGNLAEGIYILRCDPPTTRGDLSFQTKNVQLTSGEKKTGVNFTLSTTAAEEYKTFTVRGKIVDSKQVAVPNAKVELVDTGGDRDNSNDFVVRGATATTSAIVTGEPGYNFQLSNVNLILSDPVDWTRQHNYILRVSKTGYIPYEYWMTFTVNDSSITYRPSDWAIILQEKIPLVVMVSNLTVNGASYASINPPETSATISLDVTPKRNLTPEELTSYHGGQVRVIVDTNRDGKFKVFDWQQIVWLYGNQYEKGRWVGTQFEPDPNIYIDYNNPDYAKLRGPLTQDELTRIQSQGDWVTDTWVGGWDFSHWDYLSNQYITTTTIHKEIIWEGKDAMWNTVSPGVYPVAVIVDAPWIYDGDAKYNDNIYDSNDQSAYDFLDLTTLRVGIQQTAGIEGYIYWYLDENDNGQFDSGESTGPFAGTWVYANATYGAGNAITNSSGGYVLNGLTPTPEGAKGYYLSAGAPGYKTGEVSEVTVYSGSSSVASPLYLAKGGNLIVKTYVSNLPERFINEWGSPTSELWGNINAYDPTGKSGTSGWGSFSVPLSTFTVAQRIIISTITTLGPGNYELRVEVSEYGSQTQKEVKISSFTKVVEFFFQERAASLDGEIKIIADTSTLPTQWLWVNVSANDIEKKGYSSWGGASINLAETTTGHFTMRSLIPGATYTLRFESWGSGLAPKTLTQYIHSGINFLTQPVEMDAGATLKGTLSVEGEISNPAMPTMPAMYGMGNIYQWLNIWAPEIGHSAGTMVILSTTPATQVSTFTISGLAPNTTYWIETKLEGFEFFHWDSKEKRKVIGPLEIFIANTLTEAPTVYLESFTGILTGSVTGQNLNWNKVFVQIIEGPVQKPAVGLDNTGRFRIRGLDTGDYQILVNEYETSPGTGTAKPTGRFGTVIQRVSVTNATTTDIGTLQLLPGASISGTVTIYHSSFTINSLIGKTVRSVPLSFWLEGRETEGFSTQLQVWQTSATYALSGLPPETYVVTPQKDFNGDGIPDVSVSSPTTGNQIVNLTAGEEKSGVDFVLGSGFDLNGTINRSLTGVDEIKISLLNLKGEEVSFYEVKFGTSQAESALREKTFALRNLNPGRYRLRILSKGYRYKPVFLPTSSEQVIEITTTSYSAGKIYLTTGGSIKGWLIDEKTSAAVYRDVKITCEAIPFVEGSYREIPDESFGLKISTSGSTAGEFTLPGLPDGTYIVQVFSLPSTDPQAKTYVGETIVNYEVTLGTTGVKDYQSIIISGGNARDIGTIKLKQGTTISGKVTDKDGNALSNIKVKTQPRDKKLATGMEISALTDAEGKYILKGIDSSQEKDPVTGTYKFKYYWTVTAGVRPEKGIPKYVPKSKHNIAPGAKDVNFELPKANASIKGKVKPPLGLSLLVPFTYAGRDDLPVAIVLLQSAEDAASTDPMAGIIVATDHQGNLSISGILSGTYLLKVFSKNAIPFIQEIVVGEGENTLTDIQLSAGATVTGEIRTPEGKKVSTSEIEIIFAITNDFEKIVLGMLNKDEVKREINSYLITGLEVGKKYYIVLLAEGGKSISVDPRIVEITSSTQVISDRKITYRVRGPEFEVRAFRLNIGDILGRYLGTDRFWYLITVFSSEELTESSASDIISVLEGSGKLDMFSLSTDKTDAFAMYKPAPDESSLRGATTGYFRIKVKGHNMRGGVNEELYDLYYGENQKKEVKINPVVGGKANVGEGDNSGIALSAGTFDVKKDTSVENPDYYNAILVSSGIKAIIKKVETEAGQTSPRLAASAYSLPLAKMLKARAPGDQKSSFYDVEVKVPGIVSGPLANLNKCIAKKVKVTITYAVSSSTEDASKLDICYYDPADQKWKKKKENRSIDTVNKTISVDVSHLSRFAIFLDNTAPGIPQGLTATKSANKITLSWQAVTDYDLGGYEIWRSATSETEGFVFISSASKVATSYEDTSIIANKNYFYKVLAYDDASNPNKSVFTSAVKIGGYSGPFVTYTYPNPIKNPSASNPINIRYKIPGAGTNKVKVAIKIYNIAGELVKEFAETSIDDGAEYLEPWDGKNNDGEPVASGVYLYIVYLDGEPQKGQIKKIAIIK